MISEETIQAVRQSVDIVEVVSAYFPLKKRGANYWAPCPFHEEKTPSFSVHPEKQIFKCFGCGKAGGAVTFVMEYLKVDYPEAIRLLAGKAGIPVKMAGPAEKGPSRDELLRVQEWAAGVFHQQLRKAPEAEEARRFLARRGVDDGTVERFRLGYSLNGWDHLLERARREGIGRELLVAAGLARKREGREGYYDFFRGRVMFPITERSGRVIAFGARALGEEGPKFINSPESKIFSKGRGLYGLDLAREEWERTRTAYVVEGYLDVVIPYQAGVRGLVATLGTALTRDHLKILRRHVDRVVLVFDGDAAGQKASERGLDLLLEEDLESFVVGLPEGMDPDDVVVRQGPEALRSILDHPMEVFDCLLASLRARHGGETPASRTRIVEAALQRLAGVPDGIKREFLVQKLAGQFGLDAGGLMRRLEVRTGPGGAVEAEGDPADAAVEEAARGVLACAAADPEAARRLCQAVPLEWYPTEPTRRLAQALYRQLEEGGAVDREGLLWDPATAPLAAEVFSREVGREEARRRMQGYLDRLAREAERREGAALRERLRKAATEEERNEILRRLVEVRRRCPEDRGRLPGR